MISLHSRNMVHRDLRVPNILIKQCVVGRHRAFVADFGISSVGDGTGQPMDEVAGKERTLVFKNTYSVKRMLADSVGMQDETRSAKPVPRSNELLKKG